MAMKEFPPFISTLPELDIPFASASGYLLQGERQQVAFVRFDDDIEVPRHRHEAQWELVVAGEVRLDMGGEQRICGAGDSFFIPKGVEHGASISAGYRAVIFFDQPDRYRSK